MRYEHVLTGRNGRTSFIMNSQPFRSICQRLMNIYPHYLSTPTISILPNDGNKVLIPMMNAYELKELSTGKGKASFQPLSTNGALEQQKKLLDPPLKLLPCTCSMLTGKCSQIDSRTVKLALAVIDQKSSAEQRRRQEQIHERRLQHIEHKLDNLLRVFQERNLIQST